MLTVCNKTETAARVEHYFRHGNAFWPELHEPNKTLRVDSRVLEKAEVGESAGSDKAYEEVLKGILESARIPETKKVDFRALKKEELLRAIIDNVGKRNSAGQDLQNVISVAMLSEGWDAKNVTHIMGLRAFTSQLLCEQVIGRGLRRVSDSTWEAYTTQILEKRAEIASYAKNDHLGFQVYYLWRGSRRKFVPDYLITLSNGKRIVLEIKGEDSDQNRAKRLALDAWVRAVNARGGFGVWCWDVVKGEPSKVDDVIIHHAQSAVASAPIGEGVLVFC